MVKPRVKKEQDRRLNPRIHHELPLRVAANGYDFVTNTKNISSTGAYCRIKKYIPPFTKIALKMTLPVKLHNKKERLIVECQGVVVRSEDEDNGGFNIAIYFTDIKEIQRKRISQYVNQFLPQESSGR